MIQKLIVIGASAGGIPATQKILSGLRSDFPYPIVIVMHLPAQAKVNFALGYSRFTKLKMLEIEDKMPIENSTIYFAPPGYHSQIESEGSFSLSRDEPVQFSRPSIDVLFESAAQAFGEKIVGILLTGANTDGALGLKEIQASGGLTIVQNPITAEIPSMPQAALKIMEPTYILDLPEISKILNHLSPNERQEAIL